MHNNTKIYKIYVEEAKFELECKYFKKFQFKSQKK